MSASHVSAGSFRRAHLKGHVGNSGSQRMAKAQAKGTVSNPREEVICEKGRHVNCLHAKMAAKRAGK